MYKEFNLKDLETAMKDTKLPYIGLVYKGEGLEIYQIGENFFTGREGYIDFLEALDIAAKKLYNDMNDKDKQLEEYGEYLNDNPCDNCKVKDIDPDACLICNKEEE